jgi:hypothetical protein
MQGIKLRFFRRPACNLRDIPTELSILDIFIITIISIILLQLGVHSVAVYLTLTQIRKLDYT